MASYSLRRSSKRACPELWGIALPIALIAQNGNPVFPLVAVCQERMDLGGETSGKLALLIHSEIWERCEQRTRWSDAEVQRIKNLVPDFCFEANRSALKV
jgi:hypothetical protein